MPDSTLALPATAVPMWSPCAGPMLRSRTLLLVEDSRHAAEAVRLLSRRLGLRLRRAEDLATARRHLRVYWPDLALIDLGLPDGSGLDLIAELTAARPRLRRVVAMSADPDLQAAALSAGACAFVAKPLRLPADLSVLLGSEVPERYQALPSASDGGRNAGADPMALRDDLIRARTSLNRAGAADLDYASRFVQGVAHCAGDQTLQTVALAARQTGDPRPLLSALAERTAPERLALSF